MNFTLVKFKITLEHIFLAVVQNNYGDKIPWLYFITTQAKFKDIFYFHFFHARKTFTDENKKKIYIIHDDLDLELGKVKLKFGGGNGGHNGLSNIDEMIGNNYNRIRIGINHPGSKDLVSNYVLNKFTNDEMNIIEKKLDKVTDNFNILLDDQVLFLTKLAEDN